MSAVRKTLTKILVADDAPDIAARLSEALREQAGVEIIGPAGDGDEALHLYREHRPQGMVLDFRMPKMTGLEVLLAVRRTDRECLIIIITSADEEELRRKCLAAGADHFLSKTADFERAIEIVRLFAEARAAGEL